MAKALYLVIHSLDSWWVDFEGKAHGPYTSRENAALEARSLARLHAQNGKHGEVLVPDGDGRYWVIWSSRHDGEGRGFAPRRVADVIPR